MFFFLTILSDVNYFDDPITGTECQMLVRFSYFVWFGIFWVYLPFS